MNCGFYLVVNKSAYAEWHPPTRILAFYIWLKVISAFGTNSEAETPCLIAAH